MGFLDEVALLQHAGLQLLDYPGNGRAGQPGSQTFGNPGRKVEEIEIGQQHIAHTGALNLDHHILSVFELRRMNLRNGRTGQWLGIHGLIKRLQGFPQLFLDRFTDIVKRQCRGTVQTALEFHHILFRENRWGTGNKLAQLDVRGTQGFKGSTQQSRYWRAIAEHPVKPLAPHHPEGFQDAQAATGSIHRQSDATSLARQPAFHVFDIGMISHNKVLLSRWVRSTTLRIPS